MNEEQVKEIYITILENQSQVMLSLKDSSEDEAEISLLNDQLDITGQLIRELELGEL